VHEEGGKKPRWNDTLTFTRGSDTNLKIEVWDKDIIDDDLVGEGFFNLTKVYNCANTPQNGMRILTQK
jgi:Ca2+-dependent lipid-binding protein